MQTALKHQLSARREVMRAALALSLGSLAGFAPAGNGPGRFVHLQKDAPAAPDGPSAPSEAALTLYF